MDPHVNVGGNDFYHVPFPVVIDNRLFHVYRGQTGEMVIDVLLVDPATRSITGEVMASKRVAGAPATTWPSGVVTFEREEGGFAFKFRPDPSRAQLFGLAAGEELDIAFRDDSVTIMRGTTQVGRIEGSQFANETVGINIQGGTVGLGTALPFGIPWPPPRYRPQDEAIMKRHLQTVWGPVGGPPRLLRLVGSDACRSCVDHRTHSGYDSQLAPRLPLGDCTCTGGCSCRYEPA